MQQFTTGANWLQGMGTLDADRASSRETELINRSNSAKKLGLRDGMMHLYYTLRYYNYESHTYYAVARLSSALDICATLKCNLRAMDAYIEALDRNECVEILDKEFWDVMNSFPQYEGSLLEQNLLSKNVSLKDHNLDNDKCIESCIKDTKDIHRFLKEGIEKLLGKLAIAQNKLFHVDPKFYINLYEEEKKRFNLSYVIPAYNIWRLDVLDLIFDEEKKKQTKTVADFVKWGGLRHAADPSNEDLEKVYEEKVKQFMPHNYEYPIDFKQRCAVVRKYLYWNGELRFINKAKMAWYMHRYYYKMTDVEFKKIFELEMMLSLINEDLISLDPKLSAKYKKEETNHQTEINIFAPAKAMKVILNNDWFFDFCKDKSIGKAWIDTFIDNLFASEYGLQIAKDWEKVRKRIKIKAGIIGCLWGADFLEGSNMQIAKAILQGEKGNRSSFAEYMGLGRKEPYAKWIYDYVK